MHGCCCRRPKTDDTMEFIAGARKGQWGVACRCLCKSSSRASGRRWSGVAAGHVGVWAAWSPEASNRVPCAAWAARGPPSAGSSSLAGAALLHVLYCTVLYDCCTALCCTPAGRQEGGQEPADPRQPAGAHPGQQPAGHGAGRGAPGLRGAHAGEGGSKRGGREGAGSGVLHPGGEWRQGQGGVGWEGPWGFRWVHTPPL